MNTYKFYSAQGYSPSATNTRHAKMVQAYSVVERSSEVLRLQSSLEDELLLTQLNSEIVIRRLKEKNRNNSNRCEHLLVSKQSKTDPKVR